MVREWSGAMVVPADDLAATVAFFVDELAFRVRSVRPADSPRVVVVTGHGVAVELSRDATGDPGVLRLEGIGVAPQVRFAPNGTRIEIAPVPQIHVPPLRPAFGVTRAGPWVEGRAGMAYRDLVPDRQGGHVIASHIRISGGGDVPDYVHYHDVRAQLIWCVAGWVRVVYEDQGPPFELHPGDAVLQPPGIRHRVLACSPGLEVLEVGCPADHVTHADPELSLPSDTVRPNLEYGGQRFWRHHAGADPRGISVASGGAIQACVGRPVGGDARWSLWFVLDGVARAVPGGVLAPGDAVSVPRNHPVVLEEPSDDFRLLTVGLQG